MTPRQEQEFWAEYDRRVRAEIERACRRASKRLTDGRLDADDMSAWVHTRVWRMLEKGAWPTFHDDPDPDVAIDRLIRHSKTLARWAYLALVRSQVRRAHNQQQYLDRLSQAERLAMVSGRSGGFERTEQTKADLERVRDSLKDDLRARIAASWQDKSERARIASALGAVREQDDELIEKSMNGEVNPNTLDQWRSRSRRAIRDQLGSRLSLFGLIVGVLAIGLTTVPAVADGEQSGGRGGRSVETASLEAIETFARGNGEQSGGRGG